MSISIRDYATNVTPFPGWAKVFEEISDQITIGNLSNPIIFPAGKYEFSRTVVPSGQIIVEGAGDQHTQLFFPEGMDGFHLKSKRQFVLEHPDRPNGGNASGSQFMNFLSILVRICQIETIALISQP